MINLFFTILLEAMIANGITRIEPSNDPSNDILIVSINGSQIELEYSQFGGNILPMITKNWPPRVINVFKLNPVILPAKYIAINSKIVIKITLERGSLTVVPFSNVYSFGAKSSLSFI